MVGYILDALLILVVVFCIVYSAKKGFIAASKNIITLVLTVTLLASMQGIMLSALQSSPLGDNIKKMVSKNVTKTYQEEQLPENADTTDTQQSLEICETMPLPDFLKESIEESIIGMSEVKNNVMEVITDSITMLIMRIIAMLMLFVLVKLFVFLAIKILDSLFGLPGLRGVNRSLGAVIGIVNAMLAVYIICGMVSLFTPMQNLEAVDGAIGSTYILKYFYNNNLLLSLFM